MRRLLLSMGLAALALSSLACLEITEEITVREDGSARYFLDLAVSDRIVRVGDAQAPPPAEGQVHDLSAEFRRLADQVRHVTRDVSDITSFEADESVDACGYRHLVIALNVRDAEDLPRVLGEVFSGLVSAETGKAARERPPRRDLVIEEIGDDDLGVLRRLPPDGLLGVSDEPAALIALALAKSALADHHLRVVVRGPGIVSANGEIAADRRSVAWRLPLGRVLTGSAEPLDLRAEIRVPSSHWPFFAIVLTLALLAGVAAIIWLRRREPETWRS